MCEQLVYWLTTAAASDIVAMEELRRTENVPPAMVLVRKVRRNNQKIVALG